MSAQPLKVGLIGPGSIARLHVDAIRRIPWAELVAVAASNEEKAQKIGKEWGVPFAYGNYSQLLGNEQVEVVHIATRNRSHYPITVDALEAGKHVICEKPLASNSRETAEMLNKASASGLVHAVCYNNRFYPIVHHLRELIAQGELGRVHTIHGSYLQDWLFPETAYNWRLETEESGPSSTVADIGTHWLDMVQFLTGLQVSTVISDLNTVISERRKAGPESADGQTVRESKISISTEDSASVLIDFEGKAKGCLMLSQVAAGHKNRLAFEINGTRASAAWNSERPNELWIGYRDRPNELMISETSLLSPQAKAICGPGHTKGILDVWYQFLNAVYREIRRSEIFNRDEVSFATFVDGHRDIKILEAIIASHQARGWLAVDQ